MCPLTLCDELTIRLSLLFVSLRLDFPSCGWNMKRGGRLRRAATRQFACLKSMALSFASLCALSVLPCWARLALHQRTEATTTTKTAPVWAVIWSPLRVRSGRVVARGDCCGSGCWLQCHRSLTWSTCSLCASTRSSRAPCRCGAEAVGGVTWAVWPDRCWLN